MNLSWGTSTYKEGLILTKDVLRAPAGSRLHQEATALLGHPPTPADGPKLHDTFCRRIDEHLQSPEVAEQMSRARERLGADLADAQREGVVVIRSAGNDHDRAQRVTDPRYAQSCDAGVPNLVSVGAGQLNDVDAPQDDAMSAFSNAGATLSAPGVGIPVGAAPGAEGAGPAAPEDINGTSFSAPYVSMTAALMIKANPSLSATELYEALRDPSICRDLPGGRDGNGMLDPVAAVSLAKSLAHDG